MSYLIYVVISLCLPCVHLTFGVGLVTKLICQMISRQTIIFLLTTIIFLVFSIETIIFFVVTMVTMSISCPWQQLLVSMVTKFLWLYVSLLYTDL